MTPIPKQPGFYTERNGTVATARYIPKEGGRWFRTDDNKPIFLYPLALSVSPDLNSVRVDLNETKRIYYQERGFKKTISVKYYDIDEAARVTFGKPRVMRIDGQHSPFSITYFENLSKKKKGETAEIKAARKKFAKLEKPKRNYLKHCEPRKKFARQEKPKINFLKGYLKSCERRLLEKTVQDHPDKFFIPKALKKAKVEPVIKVEAVISYPYTPEQLEKSIIAAKAKQEAKAAFYKNRLSQDPNEFFAKLFNAEEQCISDCIYLLFNKEKKKRTGILKPRRSKIAKRRAQVTFRACKTLVCQRLERDIRELPPGPLVDVYEYQLAHLTETTRLSLKPRAESIEKFDEATWKHRKKLLEKAEAERGKVELLNDPEHPEYADKVRIKIKDRRSLRHSRHKGILFKKGKS